MNRILVIDDEPAVVDVVVFALKKAGFLVQVAGTLAAARRLLDARSVDLLVLDLGLPDGDGMEFCRQVRAGSAGSPGSDIPVLILTCRDDEVDRVIGLESGADDYVVKPFSPRELVARVRAMLRRPRTTVGLDAGSGSDVEAVIDLASELLQLNDLSIDRLARKAWMGTRELEVTRTEFDILATMAARPRMAFTRRQLIDSVWGSDWYGDEHIVDVHIGHLRRKLGDDAAEPAVIRTVRGVGYGMVADK